MRTCLLVRRMGTVPFGLVELGWRRGTKTKRACFLGAEIANKKRSEHQIIHRLVSWDCLFHFASFSGYNSIRLYTLTISSLHPLLSLHTYHARLSNHQRRYQIETRLNPLQTLLRLLLLPLPPSFAAFTPTPHTYPPPTFPTPCPSAFSCSPPPRPPRSTARSSCRAQHHLLILHQVKSDVS